jgi:hypothetical protein
MAEEVLNQDQLEQQVPQQEDPPKKLSVKEFASKIKAKYPEYKDVDDNELTSKMLSKFPVYKDQVDFSEKKNDGSISQNGGQGGIPPTPSQSQLKSQENGTPPKIKSLSDLGIDLKGFYASNKTDALAIKRPITVVDIEQKKEQAATYKKNKDLAIDNTTSRALKAKNFNVDKNSPIYKEQRRKIEKAVENGDATYVMGKDGVPGLNRTIGFWESLTNGWNRSVNSNEEAENFVKNMTTEERVAYANRKEEKRPTGEYVGELPGVFGAAGELIGENAQFLGKAALATGAAASLVAAAPETFGASLAGLPAVAAFAYTAPDMINQGGMQETLRRYNVLKKEKPNVPDVDLMKEAEGGMVVGEIAGGVTNAALMGMGGNNPISQEGKSVVANFINNGLKSATHMGTVTGLVEGGKEIVGGIQGIKTSPTEVIQNSLNTFKDNFTVGLALHGVVSAVTGTINAPKAIVSSLKYALKDESPVGLIKILQSNEQTGAIPEGTTEVVMNDLNEYNQALSKTSDGLSPESKASIAGLMQKRKALQDEMSVKDFTQTDFYQKKIDAINLQIQEITKTDDPFSVEVDDITGKKLDGKIEEAPVVKENIVGEHEQIQEGVPEPTKEKIEPYDKENIPGLPSKVGVGEEPVTTEPIKGAGTEEVSAGGVLQAPGVEGEVKTTGKITTTPAPEKIQPVELKENEKIIISPQIKGGMPREMIYKDGEWKQQVGGQITSVGKGVQLEAQQEWESKTKSAQQVKTEVTQQKSVGEQKDIIINPKERTEWKGYKVGDVIDGNKLDELSGDLVGNKPKEKFILVQTPLSEFTDSREQLLFQEKGYEQEEIDRLESMKSDFDKTPPIPDKGDGMHRIIAAKELGHETILQWKNVKDVKQAELPKQEQKGVGEVEAKIEVPKQKIKPEIKIEEEKELPLKPKEEQYARTEKETGAGEVKINSEKVRYNGTDAIGSRTRTKSEQTASRKEAKEKIKNPETNASLKAANSYNESVGLPEVTPHKYKPSDPVQQTKIAKLYPELQDVNSPTYKETKIERRIYSEYKSKHPEIFKQYDIKDYKDLVNKSYEQLIKETQLQYDALPVKVTFHEAGEGNYENNFEMLDDVHNFNHLWVYKGGDDHTALGSKTIDKEGLTANDKFRAVHDYYGHSVEGYQFGKDGEENAWIEHSKMFSPLAQWALSSETRGQNSWVNYSGANDVVLQEIKLGSALKSEGERTGNQEMINEGEKLLNTVYDKFQFAEQKAMILPPEFTDVSKFHENKISKIPEQLKTKENENIQNKENQRKSETKPGATTEIDKERLEQSTRNANKREEAKTNLIKLRDEGILVTADKSIIAKAKKAIGMKVGKVPMTDAEINAQMSMLDAMSNVWKETTGQDNFYDTFISDIKKGDLKAVKDKGGVLFQDESVPTRPISRVTLSVFDAPQFEKMKGQMVVPQSISDFIKGKGKQIEKDIINGVLAFDKYKGQKRISFDDFKNDVEIQVMKLEKIKSNSYASYGMDNLGGGYGDAKTIIFNAPVDHGETGHFSGDFTTMGIDGKSWELRQIPNTEVWAAVDKDMPDNTPQAEIQKYVGTAGNKGEVEHWINQRDANSSTGNINKGLFGHIRAWFDKRNNVFHLAELQSDVYQKSKAADLFAELVPKYEVDEYMNREVWGNIGDEKTAAILEERGYKVERVKDEWKVFDKNGRVLAERTIFDTEPGFKEGQYDKNEVVNNALGNEINEAYDLAKIPSNDFAEINKQITKLDDLLSKVKSNREFDAINKEIESLKNKLYKYEVIGKLGVHKRFKLKEFDTHKEAENYIDDLLKERAKIQSFREQLGDYFQDKVNNLIGKKQEFIDKRAKEIKAEKGENMLEKQFIASQKVHEMRLFREAMKHAAEEGADVVRFPSPYTLAVIEGYVDHTGEGNAPYDIVRGDSNRLEQGDIIEYGGTELIVVDSDRSSITVSPRDETNSYNVDDFIYEEVNNRVSEIEYEAAKHFNDLNNITKEEIENYSPDEFLSDSVKRLLEEEIEGLEEGEAIKWSDIETKLNDDVGSWYNGLDYNDLFGFASDVYPDGYGNVYVVENGRNTESFNQPDGYEAQSTEADFEGNLSRDQQTVVDKYKEMGAMIKKTRPDAIEIRDDNGMEWIETKITDADRNNPIIAFQNEGGKIKGAVDFMNDNKATFHIFDGADISTLAHEITGHLGRRFLEKLAETDEQFSKDYDAVRKWANVKDNQWTTRAEEKFARGFERYLREGKAPTKALEAVFANLKEWLVNIYKNIKGSSIDVKLTQEVKDVFGRLLGGEVKAEKPKMEEKVTPEVPEQKAKIEIEAEKPEVIEEEVKPLEERKTGVKKAITTPLREALGLPAVELPKMGKDVEELQQAKQRIDSGDVDPISMVDDILKSDRGYKDEKEVYDMQYYAHQLDSKDKELSRQMSESDNDIDKSEIANKKQLLSDEIDRQTEAARKAGNKWGKIGLSMQPVIDAGFNISRERNLIKEAYAGEVPQQVKEKIDAITKERDEAIIQRDKIEKDLIDLKAKKEIEKNQKQVQAEQKGKPKKTKEEFIKERQNIIDKIKKKWKDSKGGGTMYSLAVPIPIEKIKQLAAISPEVGELIKSHVEEGVSKLDDIVTNIHDLLKDQIDGLTKKDVLDLIGGKYNISKERSEAAKKVAEIRAEAKKLLKENPTPNERMQSEIERLNKKADNIEAKLKEQIVVKEKESELNPYNNSEWIKADQRVYNAEKKMRDLKRQAFESQKNWFQKSLMWAGRGVRLAILSGYKVLGKLTSAATIGAAAKRIPEQAIGSIYNKVFSSISKKAPIEGSSMALNSELKWYKEFFNPKKFLKNSWDILKTGTTHLNRKMGKSEYEHIPVLYLPTDLHQIIKDPVKRATFEASFDNAMRFAAKEGLDVTDPLIIQTIENAAFKRAEYEIFQESNALTRKFTAWKNEMEKKGNVGATGKFIADFFIPISSVPTNIARRVGITSPFGLLKANVDVINAYRKGIENLKPEEADVIMRQLKQGSLGTALWAIGWFGFGSFGGLYTKFNPNKQRDDEDLASDKMEVGGVEIPKPTQHALPLEVIQTAATARRLWNKYNEDEETSTFEAIAKAGLASIGAVAEQVPVIETPVHMIMATQEPFEAKKLGEDIKSRIQPQILKETGIISKDDKEKKIFTEKEMESDKYKKIVDAKLKIPSIGRRLSYDVKPDELHPKGKMTAEEFDKFSNLVAKYSHANTESTINEYDSQISKLRNLIKSESDDPKVQSEITILTKKINAKLEIAHKKAIEKARRELKFHAH